MLVSYKWNLWLPKIDPPTSVLFYFNELMFTYMTVLYFKVDAMLGSTRFCKMLVVTENLLLTFFRLPQVLFKKMELVVQVCTVKLAWLNPYSCNRSKAIRCKKVCNCQKASSRIVQIYN